MAKAGRRKEMPGSRVAVYCRNDSTPLVKSRESVRKSEGVGNQAVDVNDREGLGLPQVLKV